MARPFDHEALLPDEVAELLSRELDNEDMTEIFHRVEEVYVNGFYSQSVADTIGYCVPDENGDLSLGLLTTAVSARDPVRCGRTSSFSKSPVTQTRILSRRTS